LLLAEPFLDRRPLRTPSERGVGIFTRPWICIGPRA
jgi:hypothetical protein